MVHGTADATVSTQLTQGQLVVLCHVGSDTHGFTHGGDTTGATGGSNGVCQREFGVDVKVTTRHHQMLGNGLSVTRLQGT